MNIRSFDCSKKHIIRFQERLLNWFQKYGRHHLPWQHTDDPYKVWISEIMLQQTQVETVIPYFERFIKSFPNISILSSATLDEVLHHWSGLGYYARARNIHISATLIQQQYQGCMPDTLEELMSLPGIGRSTAGAILSFGFHQHAAILDGNVKRVLCRHFAISGWPGKSAVLKYLWIVSTKLTPVARCQDYNQAMMDLGSSVCKSHQPLCVQCPLQSSCDSFRHEQQHLYPQKKPTKKKPVKSADFFMVVNDQNHVLLVKRPPVGIWGSLWSLPDSENLDRTNLKTQTAIRTHSFKHQFSHYTLNANVYLLRWKMSDQIMDENGVYWYDPHARKQIGIPQPIQSLLNIYFREANHDKNGAV